MLMERNDGLPGVRALSAPGGRAWNALLCGMRDRLGHPAWLVCAAALWMATVCNLALWSDLQSRAALQGPCGLLFGAALALMIAAALVALLSLAAWRWTLKPAVILLLLASAGGLHFMLAYGTVIDPTMITNVLQTDVHEVDDLLSPRLAATLLLLGVLPAFVVWRAPLRRARWPRQLAHNAGLLLAATAVFVAVLLASFQPLASTMRNHHELRYRINPLNSLYALGQAAARPLRQGRMPLQPLGEDAQPGPSYAGQQRPPLLVLVLGETGRSGNFGINGYERSTTPELARGQVASFRNAWSCGTSTAASVPCMFSHLGRRGFEARSADHENLLDVVRHAGLGVVWVDNQAGCKGVCERVASYSTSDTPDPALCRDGECLDEVLLQGLDQRIAALPAPQRARGVVVVLHQIGSHGPAYFKRSPPAYKRFQPECGSNALQDCTREQLVNAYDNSIAYTDHVLGATLRWLRAQAAWDTAMVYVADHGESLGENNLYLHGMPYAIAPEVQKRVPWITWLSAAYRRSTQLSLGCLQAKAESRISHDHYFHSVLGLMDVQTRVYQRELDAYAGCARDAGGAGAAAARL
jgi:lipid A ethanolaminephosphotransferase